MIKSKEMKNEYKFILFSWVEKWDSEKKKLYNFTLMWLTKWIKMKY